MTVTRRALLATLTVPSTAAAPSLRLAFSLYGMKSYPVGEAVQACKEIGYEGVEVCLLDGWPMDAAQLKSALAKTGLEAASYMENLDALANPTVQLRQLERLKKAADLSLTMGPRQPAVVETVLGGKPDDWGRKEYMADRLLEWAGIMEKRHVVLCVKAHVGAAVDTPEKLLWLHSKVNSPNLKLTYDYSHFQLMGLDPAVTMKQLIPFTRFVHVKDAAGTAEKPQFLIPGDGRLDYKEHFRQLKKFGYKGWVVVEVSSQIHMRTGYNPLRVARQCYERLRPVID